MFITSISFHVKVGLISEHLTQLIRVIQLIQLLLQVKQVKSVSFNDSITVCSLFVISTIFDVKVGLISNQALFRKKENLSSQSFLSGLNYISVGQVSKISAQQFSRKYILLFIRTIKTASYLFLRFFVVFFVNVCVLLQNLFESVLMKRLVGEWGCK